MLEEEQFSDVRRPGSLGAGRCRTGARCSTIFGRACSGAAHEARTHGLRFSLARREIEASWGVAQPRGSAERGVSDRRFLLVRLAPAGPASQIPSRSTTTRSTSIARLMGSAARTIRWPRWHGTGEWLEAPFWIWRARTATAPRTLGPPALAMRWTCASPARTRC